MMIKSRCVNALLGKESGNVLSVTLSSRNTPMKRNLIVCKTAVPLKRISNLDMKNLLVYELSPVLRTV